MIRHRPERSCAAGLALLFLLGGGACRRSGDGTEKGTGKQAAATPAPAAGPTQVSDFEAGMTTSFATPWIAINDKAAGGISTAQLVIADGGAAGTKKALKVTGDVKVDSFPFPFAGAGLLFAKPVEGRPTPMDLRGYRGMKLWVKGDGKSYMLRVQSNKVKDFNFHFWNFTAKPEWQQIDIPFASLKQFEWGNKIPWSEAASEVAIAMVVNYSAPGENFGAYELYLDQVSLY